MDSWREQSFLLPILSLVLVLCSVSNVTQAQSRFIRHVEAIHDEQWPEIFVHLTVPMHYVEHAPHRTSDTLRIQLQPVWTFDAPEIVLNRLEVINWKPSVSLPLLKVTYDTETKENHTLALEFKRKINFKVRTGSNNRSVIITLKPSEERQRTTNSGTESPDETSRNTSDDIPGGDESSYSYVINLKSSESPINIDNLPGADIIKRYHIYTTRYQGEDRILYRLRLGFFPTAKAAGEILELLKNHYPSAWIGLVAERENIVSRLRNYLSSRKIAENDFDPEFPFVINLKSSRSPIKDTEIALTDIPQKHFLYRVESEVDGRKWYYLRLGFFPTLESAQQMIGSINADFPRVFIAKPSRAERVQVVGGYQPLQKRSVVTAKDSLSKPVTTLAKQQNNPISILAKPKAATVPSAPESLEDQTDIGLSKSSNDVLLTERPDTSQNLHSVPTATAQLSSAALLSTTNEALKRNESERSDSRLEALMEEARRAMARADYSRAVAIYNKIIQEPENSYQQHAQELLGVARERKGQLAHAKAEYQRYLIAYPEGEGADRVKQRLEGLITARNHPKEKLRKAKLREKEHHWDYFGGIGQYYRRYANVIDGEGEVVSQSSLTTDLDITTRRRGEEWNFSSQIAGSYIADVLDGGRGDRTKVSSLYFDVSDTNKILYSRMGRQYRSTGGVLGRFDGALFSHQVNEWGKINVVTGFPVESTKDNLQTDRHFYGMSVDLGTFADAWDFVGFVIEQKNKGLIDRRAIGGELRYFDSKRSFFSLFDYDIFYQKTNNILFFGNWIFDNQISLHTTIDYRQSPILTSYNALQGQPFTDISELRTLFTEEEIFQLARDRTADSRTYLMGASYPLNDKFQISGDAMVTSLSGTPASGGVEAVPGTGNDVFLSTRLIATDLIKTGDVHIFGFRYADMSTTETYSLILNNRYPVNRHQIKLKPKFIFHYRKYQDDSHQIKLYPSLQIEYRWRKRTTFELEGGGEWSKRNLPNMDDSKAYFISIGYRHDF